MLQYAVVGRFACESETATVFQFFLLLPRFIFPCMFSFFEKKNNNKVPMNQIRKFRLALQLLFK